jgi:hypothetical protein
VPAGKEDNVKLPVLVLAAEYSSLVPKFLTWILALEITAPVGSRTVPVIVPRSVWASAADARRRNTLTVEISVFTYLSPCVEFEL